MNLIVEQPSGAWARPPSQGSLTATWAANGAIAAGTSAATHGLAGWTDPFSGQFLLFTTTGGATSAGNNLLLSFNPHTLVFTALAAAGAGFDFRGIARSFSLPLSMISPFPSTSPPPRAPRRRH